MQGLLLPLMAQADIAQAAQAPGLIPAVAELPGRDQAHLPYLLFHGPGILLLQEEVNDTGQGLYLGPQTVLQAGRNQAQALGQLAIREGRRLCLGHSLRPVLGDVIPGDPLQGRAVQGQVLGRVFMDQGMAEVQALLPVFQQVVPDQLMDGPAASVLIILQQGGQGCRGQEIKGQASCQTEDLAGVLAQQGDVVLQLPKVRGRVRRRVLLLSVVVVQWLIQLLPPLGSYNG